MVASLALTPSRTAVDPSGADVPSAAPPSHDVTVVSRSAVRTAGAGRRAVPLDNAAARAATDTLKRRQLRRERAARQAAREAALEAARIKAAKKRLQRAARLAAMEKTSTFRVGALNILGSQHTVGPGGYGPGTVRAGISAGIIMARGVDVVVLSEVQDDQLNVLNARMGGWSIWPQQSLGRNGQRLQVAWRDTRFEMVDGGSVAYPFDNQTIPQPYVLLRDRVTGAEFWVIPVHNSARDLEGERDAATAIQIALMQRLMAESGKPIIIGGDVNEREEFFYRVCGTLGFLAANGGAGCSLPPPPLRVDWIMGGGGGGVTFSDYVQDGSVRAAATDHYLLYADVSVVDPGGQP